MRMVFIWIFFLQELYSLTMSVTLVGDPLAIQGQDYKLTCNRTNISPEAEMDWYKDGIKVPVLCNPLAGWCAPSQLDRYNFTTDSNGMYIHITGLRRSEDQRQWKCTYKSPMEEDTMNMTIFTIPNGLIYTQEPTRGSDLSLSAVTLECVTSSCVYPVPVINWYYKDPSLPGLATLYKTTGTQTAEANCTSPENISSSRLELLQNTTWSDNSNKTVTFFCGIDYPKPLGTVYSKDSFTITFAIRVTYVQMRQNSTTVGNTTLVVTSGDPITLSCVSGTSRPDPTIEWFIENENKGSGANFTFIPADTDHDKTIYCRAYNTNPNIPVESAKPRMFVRVRVTNVTLQGNGNGVLNGTLIVTSGQPATLTCVTGTSRPPAVIEWYFRSQMMGNETSLTFTPTNKDHDTDIYCQAYNTDPSKPVISIKQRLFVKVIVSNVTFLDSSSGTMVFYEGYPKTLKCISSPSRPVSSITWWFESQSGTILLTNNITNTEEPAIDGLHKLISEITLTLIKDSRNKKIFCNGNIDGQQHLAVSPKVNVDVWFQPQKPEVMEINAAFPWLVSGTGTLYCHSNDYGNPNSSITWTSHRGIKDSLGHLVYQQLVPDDNGKVVSCQLINSFTIMMNTSIISESVTLNVEYSPIIRMNMTDFLTVNETQSVSVLCTASGNPIPNQTVWREKSADNILRFNNIGRTVTSNYTCESTAASLTHGTLKSQRTIAIIVQYAPDVIVTTTGPPQENMSSSIRCEVKGVPALFTFHPWKHMWGDVLIRDNLQQNSTGSNDNTLWFERMTLQDTGTYICSADNGIKGINGIVIQKGTVDINIIAIPVIVMEDNNLITEELGHSVNISIHFYSYPAIISFVFMKNGTKVENTSRTSMQLSTVTVNYTSYSKTVNLEAQVAQLFIQNLTLHDFDNYTLLLKNSFGPKSFTVKLDPAGPPMKIKRFYFNRFMEKQIELHFDPGFNGGRVQTFIIEYKSTTGPDNAWTNSTDLNERHIQNRLPNGTYFLTVMQLSPGNYNYRMYSKNKLGRSLYSEEISVFIPEDPPNVIVESINGSYTEKGLLIKCSAHAISERYAFRLIHSSLYSGIKIRQLSFDNVSTGTIIYQFASPTYMDTGIYTCTVSNGIPEYEEGSMDKSANGTVWIRDIPRVTSIDRSFYAENGYSGRLVIELFSSLLDPKVLWYKHNSGTLNKLLSSEKYNILLSSTLVNVDFYSVTILQPGYIATLEIKNMTRDDFGSFQVYAENSVGEMSPLILNLKATASEPQDTSHNGPDGVLLGGVLGSAVLVSIVVAVVGVILYRRRNKYHDHQSGEESTRNREHDVVQNRKGEDEHYQELQIIAGQVDEKNQTRSAGSPVYQTLATYDNIREHEYSHLNIASG